MITIKEGEELIISKTVVDFQKEENVFFKGKFDQLKRAHYIFAKKQNSIVFNNGEKYF